MVDISAVCVYCGSRDQVDQAYRDAARDLGRHLAESAVALVYGGGRVGLMGRCADAALAAGGTVIGIIPEALMKIEVDHRDLTELIVTPDMHSRKRCMIDRADAFVLLPGGLGSLDEIIEVITWRQLGLHDKPIIVINIAGYWDPLLALIEHIIAQGFANSSARGLYCVVASAAEVIPAIEAAPRQMFTAHAKLR